MHWEQARTWNRPQPQTRRRVSHSGTSVTDRLRALADCGVTTVTRSAFGSRDEQTATRAVLVSVLD